MNKRTQGIIALVLLTLVFASMGLFARFLSTGFSLFQQVYLRVAAALFIGYLVFRKDIHFSKLRKIKSREWLLLAARATANYVLGVVLFTKAILLTKYGNVSFIGALPLTAVLGFIFLKEKVTLWKVLCVVLAFAGVALITVKDTSSLLFLGGGEMAALLSCIACSFGYISRRFHSKLLNNKEITLLIFAISLPLLMGLSFVFGEGVPSAHWSWMLLATVLVAGAFNTANMFLSNFGFEHVEAVLASNILTLESAFAVALGFFVFREVPVMQELMGGVLIVASVFWMNSLETTS